jgi:hypothetical protein
VCMQSLLGRLSLQTMEHPDMLRAVGSCLTPHMPPRALHRSADRW